MCTHFQLAISIQANVWYCRNREMGQNVVIAKRPLVVPQDMVFYPRKNLLRPCCPAPNHSRVEGKRMLTHSFLGHLRYFGWLDTVYRLNLRDPKAPFFSPASTPFFLVNGSLLFHDTKTQLISGFSRMYLWPGENPDYTFNGTSCFLNQEQDFIMIT